MLHVCMLTPCGLGVLMNMEALFICMPNKFSLHLLKPMKRSQHKRGAAKPNSRRAPLISRFQPGDLHLRRSPEHRPCTVAIILPGSFNGLESRNRYHRYHRYHRHHRHHHHHHYQLDITVIIIAIASKRPVKVWRSALVWPAAPGRTWGPASGGARPPRPGGGVVSGAWWWLSLRCQNLTLQPEAPGAWQHCSFKTKPCEGCREPQIKNIGTMPKRNPVTLGPEVLLVHILRSKVFQSMLLLGQSLRLLTAFRIEKDRSTCPSRAATSPQGLAQCLQVYTLPTTLSMMKCETLVKKQARHPPRTLCPGPLDPHLLLVRLGHQLARQRPPQGG